MRQDICVCVLTSGWGHFDVAPSARTQEFFMPGKVDPSFIEVRLGAAGLDDPAPATRFDLFSLRLFVDVVERRSIGKGAALNFITVSAASKRIADLERILGVQLLQREARGVSVTPAGGALYKGAADALARLQQLAVTVALHRDGAARTLRVSSSLVSLSSELPAAIKAFTDADPGVSLTLTERATDATLQALVRGEADVGVVTPIHIYPESLMAFRYAVVRHVLVVPRGHALAGCASVRLDDAAACNFIGLEREGGWDRLLHQVAQERGLSLRVATRVSSFDVMCRMAGSGLGVAIVPLATAQLHAPACDLALLPLSEPWAEIPLDVCWRQQPEPPDEVQRLLAHLKRTRDAGGWAPPGLSGVPHLKPRDAGLLGSRRVAVPA
ncbi:MAG: LysR family transcriptional regulator [Rhizobacter sp.]|nr:LysR family transcriptional regulator [Rhizobacter sp.]